jgi:hypothetical protein
MPDLQSDIPKDNIYECEAKRLVMRDGVKVREWRLTPVADVIADELDEYRCKDCKGRVMLLHPTRNIGQELIQSTALRVSIFARIQAGSRDSRKISSNDIRFLCSKAKRKIPHPLLTR